MIEKTREQGTIQQQPHKEEEEDKQTEARRARSRTPARTSDERQQ